MTRSHCCLRLTRGQPCLGGSAAIACSTRRGSVGAVPLSQAPLLSEAREVDSAGPNRQLVGLIRSRDPDVLPRRKHNRNPSGGAPCNPMKKSREEHLRKSLFRHLLPKRATSTDFSLSATPFHFFSPSTSGMGTARHRLIDRGGPRGDVRQPAASQRVQDGHAGRWSSCLRNSHFILNRISKNVEKTQAAPACTPPIGYLLSVALVAGAGRRCTYTVCTFFISSLLMSNILQRDLPLALISSTYSSYRHVGTAGAVRCGAVRCGRAIKTIVASGSRPAPETPLKQRAVERTLCSEQSGHAGGWIARCDALICTTDEAARGALASREAPCRGPAARSSRGA